jgi:S-adenosylmethionine hydrolase
VKTPLFLLSDFGYSDGYVAQMKAVILSFSGYDTPVIDITHSVLPGNILHGAYHLRSTLPRLPEGSVTLAVVDPGVGSRRFGLAALWHGRFVVAPDNGLISMLSDPVKTWKLPDPEPGSAPAFHGRDVFAPAAARLALDPGWTSFLALLKHPVLLKEPLAVPGENSLSAVVLHTDNFGNCVTCITEDDLNGFVPAEVITDSGSTPVVPVDYYIQGAGSRGVVFLMGSQGYYEIAVSGGSAAEKLGLNPGDTVSLRGN